MKKRDLVIVGGSVAGPIAGVTARRHYKDASILLVRREEKNKVMVCCGIPYIFGTVGSPDKNVIPDALLSNNGIELMVDEIDSVDRTAKTMTTAGGESIAYEKLILATGSGPVRPPILGMDLENVFAIWKDADYLAGMQQILKKAKDVVIIGGGFIGAEMADECKKIRNANVSIIEICPHCLTLALDEEFCVMTESRLAERGIKIITANGVQALLGNGRVEGVQLQSGENLKADTVIVGIGAIPNTGLAESMDLEIGRQKGIQVDEYMRTSDENVFACGDCAEKFSYFTQKPSGLRLASIATIEARIAGANAFELKRKNKGAIGVFSTAFGDFAVSAVGLIEKAAKEAGFDVVIGEVQAPDKHPPSMPNATQLKTKLIFDKKTGKIIGGQFAGGVTTGETANIVAVAILNEMTADQLATFQMGTHPALTPSPMVYPIVNAAELALIQLK